MDGGNHPAGVAVETVFGFGIADLADHFTGCILYIHVSFGSNFAAADNQPGGNEGFTCNFGFGIPS